MDMEWETVINPTSEKVLPTSILLDTIPEVVWSKCYSGKLISPEVAAKVEELWKKHLEEIK